MNVKKLFSSLFAVLGTMLMIGTLVLSILSLNAQPRILEFPQEAQRQAQTFAEALTQGDLEAASQCMYGQKSLTADAQWQDGRKEKIWNAFVESLSCTPAAEPVASEEAITWTVQLEMLDLSALLSSWEQRTTALLQGQDEPEAEVVEAALDAGLRLALDMDRVHLTRDVALNMIYRDGHWWVSPDAALLQILSGQV